MVFTHWIPEQILWLNKYLKSLKLLFLNTKLHNHFNLKYMHSDVYLLYQMLKKKQKKQMWHWTPPFSSLLLSLCIHSTSLPLFFSLLKLPLMADGILITEL